MLARKILNFAHCGSSYFSDECVIAIQILGHYHISSFRWTWNSQQQCIRNKVIFTKKVVISNTNWFAGLKFDPGDEWPEGIRVLRKLAKRDTDDNDRRRLKTKFVGDVEVVVKGTQCGKTRNFLSTMLAISWFFYHSDFKWNQVWGF